MKMYVQYALVFLLLLGAITPLQAQTLRLLEQGTGARDITVQVGQVVTIEVIGDLTGVEAAGVSVFVTVPDDAFQVVDQRPTGSDGAQPGVQPFIAGSFFQGAGEIANFLIPETDPAAAPFPGQQLEYAAIIGGAGNRVRTGSGVIVTFQLICVQPIDLGQIQIDDNAIRETRLVLSDGISERRFTTTQGMQISVSGLELLDVPDVILVPGQSDSTQIGRLTRYVQSARPSVNIDSIRWSFAPADLDSLDIEIDPLTQRVKIVPHPEWSGRQRIIWTATEPESAVRPGDPILSTQEVSLIIVNNPPTFIKERDPDGTRRDTLRFGEDEFAYIADTQPSTRRALTAFDLNERVEDLDGDDLRFVVLATGAFTGNPDVRGQVVADTGDLLIWSLQNFNGSDSLRVLVTDGLRGGTDTLLVIVEVFAKADPPQFTLNAEARQPKISRGGTKTYLLSQIVEDVDTPIDSLAFSWNDDPGDNFVVDTTRVGLDLEIAIKGRADFSGDGRISFFATDPEGLEDTMILFISASEALPPAVIQDEIKIDLTPGGSLRIEDLDGFVIDPDNSFEELSWSVPPLRNSDIGIDENRQLSVGAPVGYIGYEEVILTVTDPSGQGDELKLRIYSSDGDPVAGGLPDIIMDRNEFNRDIDLDSYYFDSDNDDTEIFWQLPGSNNFDDNNLEVNIDPITNVVTFFVPETASFATEVVIFRVTDPAGTSALDTMNVSIRSGGSNVADQFSLRALPGDIQIPAGLFTDVFDLDDFVLAAPDFDTQTLSWSVRASAGDISGPTIRDDRSVAIFGFQSGIDTLLFTAQDTLGQVQTVSAVVRVFGESEVLRLLSIPDIQFISRQTFTDLNLSDFIEDKEAHPDSLIEWSWEQLSGQGTLVVSVTDDNTVFATSNDTVTAEVVFIARDIAGGISGRDTVRVIALDESLASRDLQEFPPLLFSAGQGDSSIVLNEFLPADFLSEDGTAPRVRWLVSGQRVTQPIIDTQAPHRLMLNGVGESIGVDTLTFTADIGGGFRATGQMVVTVAEAVDGTTLDLQVVPNPIEPSYFDIFVVARVALASTPNVIRSFETIDSTVAVRQIENDLEGRGVLIWAGSIRLREGATGLIRFETQAFTELGTNVGDTASVDLATVLAGKRVALVHGGAQLMLEADAVAAGKVVALQTRAAPVGASGKWASADELQLLHTIDAYPVGLSLDEPGVLRWNSAAQHRDGLYRRAEGKWVYLGAPGQPISVSSLGRYGILRDEVAPRLNVTSLPDGGEWVVDIDEQGSGLANVQLLVNGQEREGLLENGRFRWQSTEDSGVVALELRAWDRAGNESVWRGIANVLPQQMRLGSNYPNPFNPATILPFVVSAPAQRVQLAIYNSAGQLVRELLNNKMSPGAYEIRWDGRDAGGSPVSSGVYLYRLQTEGAVQVRRMTLLK